jgi:chromosome partitioning protein
MIIAISQRKGGSGKTTLSICLACELETRGYSTMIIDADPQATASDWRRVSSDDSEMRLPSVLALPNDTLHRRGQVDRVAQGFDFVIIDCPPALGAITRSALMASDVCLLPTRPNPADIWALDGMLELVDDAQTFNDRLRGGWIIATQKPSRSKGADLGGEYLAGLSEREGVEVFLGGMFSRVTYPNSMLLGSSPTLYEPKGKAAHEVKVITDELLERIKDE